MSQTDKTYTKIEVEFAPSIYFGFFIFIPYSFIFTDHVYWPILGFMVLAISLFYSPSFSFFLKSHKTTATFLAVISLPVPIAISTSTGDAIWSVGTIILGSLSTFVFIYRFYSSNFLDKHGWVLKKK